MVMSDQIYLVAILDILKLYLVRFKIKSAFTARLNKRRKNAQNFFYLDLLGRFSRDIRKLSQILSIIVTVQKSLMGKAFLGKAATQQKKLACLILSFISKISHSTKRCCHYLRRQNKMHDCIHISMA